MSVGLMMPVPLSYFSPLVGGLPGAARLGMEPTYYWDSLQPEILDWLNSHTTADQKVRFSRNPTSLLYLRHTNRLRVGIMPHERGRYTWYVLQNRPGAFRENERDLIAHGEPATVFRKWGVPLLWVYPYHLVEAWQNGEWPPSPADRPVPTARRSSPCREPDKIHTAHERRYGTRPWIAAKAYRLAPNRVNACCARASSGSTPIAIWYQTRA